MPQYDDETSLDGQDTGSALRKKYEQEIAKRKEAEAARDKVSRELSFARAGINLEDPKTKYFVAGYDGEMETEKIKAAATEAGFLAKPEEKPSEKQDDAGDGTPPKGVDAGTQLSPEQQHQIQIDSMMFGGMAQATQQQDTSGINHRAGMEEAITKGGIEGMATYMRNHGIPVIEDQ